MRALLAVSSQNGKINWKHSICHSVQKNCLDKEEPMLCSYERVIYPQSLSEPNPSGFMVAVYTPHEKILDGSGQTLRQIKAVG